MLMRAVKMSFWVFYDHLGKLLIVNIFCACAVLTPLLLAHTAFVSGDMHKVLFFSLPLVTAVVCVLMPLLQCGLIWMVKTLIEKRDGTMKLFFTGMRLYGLRAVGLGCVYTLLSLALLSSVWFYSVRLASHFPVLGYGLSATALWIQAFVLVSAVFALPALINRNTGVFGAIKLAAVLTLDNPLFAFFVALYVATLIVFSVMPPVLLFCSFAPIAALQGSAYEMLARKYAAVQAHLAEGGKRDKSLVIDFGDDNDEYLCRGFRDLLFPWKE